MSAESEIQREALPSWALVVSTYKRPTVLLRCVVAALKQTVLPSEVIIVDASPEWEQSRERIVSLVEKAGIACRYLRAMIPTLPAQRNQGIDAATADILFMIDDDSLMFPDCAEEILKVYAADTDRQIASVGAVDVSGLSPDEADFVAPPLPDCHAPAQPSLARRLRWKIASLYDRGEASFIPYNGWPSHEVPPTCSELAISPIRSLNGFRMTFRRAVIARVRFIEWFVGSAPLEDLDATYRVSLHGMIVQCLTARLTHLLHPSGRANHFATAALWAMNGSVLLRLYGTDNPAQTQKWERRVRGRLFFEFIKDLIKRRFTLPTFRGLLFGCRRFKVIESMPLEELKSWYLQLQREVRGDKPRPLPEPQPAQSMQPDA